MRELRSILRKTAKNLDAFKHPRVSVAWQDLDMVYRRVHNPSPDLGMDIIGKKLEDLLEGQSVQARRLTEAKKRVLESGEPFHNTATLKFGGTEHTFDVSIEPTYGEDGKMDGLLSVNIDVTDLVAARRQLSAANARLVKLLDAALGEGPAEPPRRISI